MLPARGPLGQRRVQGDQARGLLDSPDQAKLNAGVITRKLVTRQTWWPSVMAAAGLVLPPLAVIGATNPGQAPPPNVLTAEEAREGWQLLFDGRTTQGWRSFRKPTFPSQGWIVEDGILKKVARVRGGDIITTAKFSEFELSWEWRIPPGANNGVKYFITEERTAAIGHEYQMIDDSRVGDPKGTTAAFYAVLPPKPGKTRPRINDWNQSRVVVRGNHVEHWLNGDRVLEYELGSPEVMAGVAQSKFRAVAGFGTRIEGHILLTDHGDEAWFRNIKIRASTQRQERP
jgi:hypothetical protein